MRKNLALLAVLSTFVLGAASAQAQELLTNAKLNITDAGGTQQLGATPSAWVVDAERGVDLTYQDAVASEGFADFDGGGSGLFFKAFTGNPPWDPTLGDVDVDFYQDNPGLAGKIYTLTGYFGAEDNYSGLNTAGEQSFLAIDFLGPGDIVLSSVSLGLEGAGLGDPAPGLNYEQFSVSGVSPAGTVEVRSRATMLDGVFFQDPGQAFVADCFSLTCVPVPEPATVALLGLGLVGLAAVRRRK